MDTKNKDLILEALLFVKTEPISKKKLSEFLKTDLTGVNEAISSLKEKLSNRGICILENGDEVMLGTAPETSGFIESILKEELSKDLGRAGLETISIILYKGPITKNEIDFVRGVNSQFIIRNLLIRGLIERKQNPDGRGSLYQPTFELLRYMGVSSVEKLPDYETVRGSLDKYQASAEEAENDEENPVSENGAKEEHQNDN